jgi:hypothetical protein
MGYWGPSRCDWQRFGYSAVVEQQTQQLQRLAGHADGDSADASMLARREDCTAVGGRKRVPRGASCFVDSASE